MLVLIVSGLILVVMVVVVLLFDLFGVSDVLCGLCVWLCMRFVVN